MKRPRYENPRDFRKALDARIRNLAEREGLPAARIRQIVVIDRFIARLAETFGPRLVVKGAIALEYRMPLARTTKDLDGDAQKEYQRQRAAIPLQVDGQERERILALATDFPSVWRNDAISQRERAYARPHHR